MEPREFRECQGLSIAHMARHCRVSSRTYARWESGEIKSMPPKALLGFVEAAAAKMTTGKEENDKSSHP